MRKVIFVLLTVLITFGLPTYVNADLTTHDDTVYDPSMSVAVPTDADHWYRFADNGPFVDWYAAVAWASGLGSVTDTVDGPIYGWRLPTIAEYSHLFNTEGVSASTPQNFSGIQSTYYWSSDEESETIAYAYHMGGGFSSLAYKTADLRGMAVNPEPVSSILFITGAATLGLSRRWRKRRNA